MTFKKDNILARRSDADAAPALAAATPAQPAPPEYGIVVRAPVMRQLLEQARQVAASKASVLIEGESGTGKELVARLIHGSSPRAQRPFIRVNCAALSESLVESELFGHEKGAFTGADESRPGRFELADGGTLLLDEISEMSVKLQAKLLRALEEEEFERVGGARTLRVDVRIVATTNRHLEKESRQGAFRQDLYYRLNAIHLQLPPLRVRREDIAVLAQHFFNQFRQETAPGVRGISAQVMRTLSAYDWPGNVRQLRNVIHRACILASGPEIDEHDLPPLETPPPDILAMPQTIAAMERQLILATLHETGGNKTAAAQRLGVTARTLHNKMKLYAREEDASVGRSAQVA
jgi:DNA-binding NtrC family response regulator